MPRKAAISKDVVKAIVDALFSVAEMETVGNVLLHVAVKELHSLADTLIDKLMTQLTEQGIACS